MNAAEAMKLLHRIALESMSSTCSRKAVGAIVATETGEVLGQGYNGMLISDGSCLRGDCKRCAPWNVVASGELLNECLCVHAEVRAVADAVARGGSIGRGSVMLCTHHPCQDCLKVIQVFGIREVWYRFEYPCAYEPRAVKLEQMS